MYWCCQTHKNESFRNLTTSLRMQCYWKLVLPVPSLSLLAPVGKSSLFFLIILLLFLKLLVLLQICISINKFLLLMFYFAITYFHYSIRVEFIHVGKVQLWFILFLCCIVFHWMLISFIHSTCWWTFGLVLSFCYYRYCCCEHSCAHLLVPVCKSISRNKS